MLLLAKPCFLHFCQLPKVTLVAAINRQHCVSPWSSPLQSRLDWVVSSYPAVQLSSCPVKSQKKINSPDHLLVILCVLGPTFDTPAVHYIPAMQLCCTIISYFLHLVVNWLFLEEMGDFILWLCASRLHPYFSLLFSLLPIEPYIWSFLLTHPTLLHEKTSQFL